MKLLIMTFSSLPCHLVCLRPKYSPQHPILKHPQPHVVESSEINSLFDYFLVYSPNNLTDRFTKSFIQSVSGST
jgi:hypothetical protein